MRNWLRSHLTYANVMVTILAFVVLTGGTAVALQGQNTVFTDDIANDTQPAAGGNPAGGLVAADLRPNSVGTSEVANSSLTGADVTDGSLAGADVANNSLTGADINESLLGIVPNADQLDGKDSSQLPAVHFGAAPQHSSSEQVVIQWNDLGARFHTDGDTDFDNRIFLENTRSSGEIHVLGGTGTTGAIEPGGSLAFDLLSGTTTFIVWNATGTRSWLVACGAEEATPLRCHGVASHATG